MRTSSPPLDGITLRAPASYRAPKRPIRQRALFRYGPMNWIAGYGLALVFVGVPCVLVYGGLSFAVFALIRLALGAP